MNKRLISACILSSVLLSSAAIAADRNPLCSMTLKYDEQAFAGITPQCDWKPKEGPMEIKVTIHNIPQNISSVNVQIDCQVQGKLKGPLDGFAPAIQGKKSFSGKMAKEFPVKWGYRTDESHGNILVYVDENESVAGIKCNGKIVD